MAQYFWLQGWQHMFQSWVCFVCNSFLRKQIHVTVFFKADILHQNHLGQSSFYKIIKIIVGNHGRTDVLFSGHQFRVTHSRLLGQFKLQKKTSPMSLESPTYIHHHTPGFNCWLDLRLVREMPRVSAAAISSDPFEEFLNCYSLPYVFLYRYILVMYT